MPTNDLKNVPFRGNEGFESEVCNVYLSRNSEGLWSDGGGRACDYGVGWT